MNFRCGAKLTKQQFGRDKSNDQIKMKKFMTKFRVSILPSTFAIFLICLLVATLSGKSSAFIERVGSTPIHSVQLTQKGYIQVRIAHDDSEKVTTGFYYFPVLYLEQIIFSVRNVYAGDNKSGLKVIYVLF